MFAPEALLPRPGSRWRAWRGPLAATCAVLALATAAAWVTYWVSLNAAIHDLQASAVRRLDSVAAALDSALARFDYLPALLETTPAVMELLARPGDPALRDQANRTLVRINAIAGADMLFVLDAGGNAQAAADWDQPITTVGHNYTYRPYMRDALANGRGRFFGVGATSRIPGYFLSYALKSGDRTLGVATVKVKLDAAERVWATLPGAMLVTDERSVVILGSRPEWKFQALRPLSPAERAVVAAEKPYDPDPGVLPWAGGGPLQTGQHVVVDGAEHLVTARALPAQRWQMQALDPLAPAYSRARTQALMAALAAAVAGLLLMAAWQSRRNGLQKLATQAALQAAHDTLEARVAERTRQLSDANTSLAAEIETRKTVEQSLHATQAELVHAAKMAVLGQLSAGLAHELNQPLAALRTLSDNAVVLMDKQRLPETRGNLERISLLVARLGELTRRLKTFAHKPGDALVPTPLGAAVANAQGLLADRLKRLDVAFEVRIRPEGLCVLADPGLVEQVLVNLMVNALDAMATVDDRTTPRRLRVLASLKPGTPGDRVQLQVQDNGPGISPAMRAHLFEPFATSKPAGAGLGLGLMISQRIVRSFGGEIGICDVTEPGSVGACFCIDLPACTAVPSTP
ncbi:MAG: sensor histidine kinase [Betaproteobacteria bacterium]|nr:sensor histidine kinase [Betaproteobacteria bacterium]